MVSSRELANIAVKQGKAMQKPKELADFIDYMKLVTPLRNVLEIGGMHGGTMLVWDQLVTEPKLLLCIDKFILEGRLELAIDVDFILFNKDSHLAQTRETIREVLNDRQLDLLFIDGDHSYEGVKADFEMYTPFVRNGGIIALHDVSIPHPNTVEHNIVPYWTELQAQYNSFVIYDPVPQPDQWGGIGVIVK